MDCLTFLLVIGNLSKEKRSPCEKSIEWTGDGTGKMFMGLLHCHRLHRSFGEIKQLPDREETMLVSIWAFCFQSLPGPC